MKTFLFGLITIAFASCSSGSGKKVALVAIRNPVHKLPGINNSAIKGKVANDTSNRDQQADTFEDYYVVVIDTGRNYYLLRDKMLNLHKSSGMDIDTLGRSYDKSKDLIALPESKDEDDIDAGDYYPRREPSENLSLEYMDVYEPHVNKKTIALIAGIYENKTSADSLLKALPSPNGAFAFKAKVYVGCMH